MNQSDAAIWTPIFGLIGVAIGGLLQVGFSLLKSRGEEARDIRHQVTRFRHEAHMYLTWMALQVSMSDSGRLASQDDNAVQRRNEEVSKRYRSAMEAGFTLVASPDYRVSQKANLTLELMKKFAAGHEGLHRVRPDRWPVAEPIEIHLDQLLGMVAPREWERRWRFRHAESNTRK